ncbi:MAG TPA: hypothetical protein VHR86_02230, partial [Armatimonadota bacterium]|nr:hypothetical protein [Armatimonadota bacterium]
MALTITALFLLLLITALASGTGARVLRHLGLEESPAVERACFALAIGLGCIAYGILALGLLHLLRLLPVLLLLAGFAILGARPGMALGRAFFRALRQRQSGGVLGLATGGMVAVLLLLALVAALAPPSGGDWDGISYHLADPALYLRQGRIVGLFWESHSNFPFTLEMLYTLALLLHSPGAARAFHWLFLALSC